MTVTTASSASKKTPILRREAQSALELLRKTVQKALQDIRYTSDEAARLGLSEVKAHRSELIGANATSHERSAFAVSDARSLTLKEILKGIIKELCKDILEEC